MSKMRKGYLYLGQLSQVGKWVFLLLWRQVLVCQNYGEVFFIVRGNIYWDFRGEGGFLIVIKFGESLCFICMEDYDVRGDKV